LLAFQVRHAGQGLPPVRHLPRDQAVRVVLGAQLDLGDEYDTLAENEKGLANKMLLKRAMHWYIKCQPSLEGGLNKVRVEKKIEEIAKLFPTTPSLSGGAKVLTAKNGDWVSPAATVVLAGTLATAGLLLSR
jgi:hypothetical protein